MLRKMFAPLLAAGLVAVTVTAQSPEKIDTAMNAKIRAEGMDRSQIMRIEHMLTDVYGPRLTGSPNHENAGKWAIKEMESWGMKNGKMEPWNWGHEGWLNERADGARDVAGPNATSSSRCSRGRRPRRARSPRKRST